MVIIFLTKSCLFFLEKEASPAHPSATENQHSEAASSRASIAAGKGWSLVGRQTTQISPPSRDTTFCHHVRLRWALSVLTPSPEQLNIQLYISAWTYQDENRPSVITLLQSYDGKGCVKQITTIPYLEYTTKRVGKTNLLIFISWFNGICW